MALAATRSSPHPDSTPAAIIIGGGGFEYSDTVSGDCGTAALGVNDLGGGEIQVQGQLISILGTIIEGDVIIAWYTRSGSPSAGSTVSYEPKGTNWISPIKGFEGVPSNRSIGVTMTGSVLLENGDTCVIDNPVVNFTSS